MIGGPVVDGLNVWMAENTRGTGSDTRSRFAVLRWRRGGAPRRVAVSTGAVDAQGTVSIVEGKMWASWRGSRQAGASLLGYHVTTNVAMIDPTGRHVTGRRNLWSGPLGFPLPVQVADINGKPFATYVRAKGLTSNPTPVIEAVVLP